MHEAGLFQDEDPDLYAVLEKAAFAADKYFLPNTRNKLRRELIKPIVTETITAQKREQDIEDAVSEMFAGNCVDPVSTLWRDESGKTLALIKPTEDKSVSETAFVWVFSLRESSDEEEVENAKMLEAFGLTSSLSDIEGSPGSDRILMTEGSPYHGEQMLYGTMTKGMAREHSTISMRAAAYGGSSGLYRSIDHLPSMFVWVEHAYISA